MIFIKGDGIEIDLDLSNSRVVAVQKTEPIFRKYHSYSILIGPIEDGYFVSSKNYSRKAWTGIDSATKALLTLQLSYQLGFNLDTLEGPPPHIFVKKNTLECTWKSVERVWVHDFRPECRTHSLYYFYPRDEACL